MRQTLENLVKQSNHLTEAARGGELDKRGEAAQFGGVYRELVEGINNTLDAMVAPIDETAEVLGQVAEKAQSQVTARRRSHHWSGRRPRLRVLGPF